MAANEQNRTVTVSQVLDSPPWSEYLDPRETFERASAMGERLAYNGDSDREMHIRSDGLALPPGQNRTVRAVADVTETVHEVVDQSSVELALGGVRLFDDPPPTTTALRAAAEAVPMLERIAHQDPNSPIALLGRGGFRGRFDEIRAAASIRRSMRWVKQAGEVVSLERVHQPVPVVVGALPAIEGASGELTAEFERSKSGGLRSAFSLLVAASP